MPVLRFRLVPLIGPQVIVLLAADPRFKDNPVIAPALVIANAGPCPVGPCRLLTIAVPVAVKVPVTLSAPATERAPVAGAEAVMDRSPASERVLLLPVAVKEAVEKEPDFIPPLTSRLVVGVVVLTPTRPA